MPRLKLASSLFITVLAMGISGAGSCQGGGDGAGGAPIISGAQMREEMFESRGIPGCSWWVLEEEGSFYLVMKKLPFAGDMYRVGRRYITLPEPVEVPANLEFDQVSETPRYQAEPDTTAEQTPAGP